MTDRPAIPPTLLTALRELITQGRQCALRAVDMGKWDGTSSSLNKAVRIAPLMALVCCPS